MNKLTRGQRVYFEDDDIVLHVSQYGKASNGVWYCRTPNKYIGTGSLAAHEVIEHKDGTISVKPSILISDGNRQWHGYLDRGMWKEI